MEDQDGGACVTISTFAACEPSRVVPVSSGVRAGGRFTNRAAAQAAASGSRMNTVQPGVVDRYEVAVETTARIPLGRPARPEEIAETVASLLAPNARYITGHHIRVDGGRTAAV